MQLRLDRLVISALAWMIIVGSGLYLFRSEQRLARDKPALRAFDLRAREAIDTMAELRSAQQAYVAAGQGVAFWVAKVATTGDVVRAAIGALRQSATADAARTALDNATEALNQFLAADKGALDFINASQPLMASDVIFTEGSLAATTVARFIEQARLADREGMDEKESSVRRWEATVMGVAATTIGLFVLVLAPVRRGDQATSHEIARRLRPELAVPSDPGIDEHGEPLEYARTIRLEPAGAVAAEQPREPSANPTDDMRLMLDSNAMDRVAPVPAPALPSGFFRATADLATDFGRVREIADLHGLIGRAAAMIDANGIVVWMAAPNGAELRPLLTHGYSSQVVARLTAVPRGANNAAAAAFRSGDLQVVPADHDAAGAVVVPIHSAAGCIGALAVEVSGGETSERVQALVAIVSAQLANVLATDGDEQPVETLERRAAQA